MTRLPNGEAVSQDQQLTQYLVLLSAVATTGTGGPQPTDGYHGTMMVDIVESNGGTATVVLEGSNDGTHWYAVGYQQVDATAVPARSVSGISVAANSAHTYQVLDFYRQLRARVTALASAIVTSNVYLIPD